MLTSNHDSCLVMFSSVVYHLRDAGRGEGQTQDCSLPVPLVQTTRRVPCPHTLRTAAEIDQGPRCEMHLGWLLLGHMAIQMSQTPPMLRLPPPGLEVPYRHHLTRKGMKTRK